MNKFGEYSFVILVIFIVIMMIIPIPTMLLNLLLILNISLALTILLVTMYVKEPLEFSIFPSVLLVTTLFRLALNVSSTRLILLNGYAGEVIEAFGNFVVGGNVAVGLIIFTILVIIQFIVITKGSERVAEVAARFTLDAMPGKQMAIDADLNAGLINEQQAKERRKIIEREADFYGAMDGASKFVKGDAIAGIIITFINIVGGLALGVISFNLTIGQAAQKYSLLSVGDGLVSQIPALLISTSTGIMVTRAASESNLGDDVISQLFKNPKVMYIIAGILVVLGIFPGLPTFSFLIMSLFFTIIGYFSAKKVKELELVEREKEVTATTEDIDSSSPEMVYNMLQIDPLELEFGYGLIALFDKDQGGDLLDRVVMIRRQLAVDLGMVVPIIRIRDNIQLPANDYLIKIKGVEVSQGTVYPNKLMALDPGTVTETIKGEETIEPAFGLPALWIGSNDRENAENKGYTVVDPPSIIATHLTEVIKKHAHELLGRQEVKALLDNLKKTNPAVVEELVPSILTLGDVQKVLGNLLREGISIKNLPTILEILADYGPLIKDPDTLTEYVRQGLSRQISNYLKVYGTPLPAITLDQSIEELISSSIQRTEHGNYLSIDPINTQTIIDRLREVYEDVLSQGYNPVVITAPLVRLYFKRLVENSFPHLVVISYNELDSKLEVQIIGTVKL
ncbi:flagellar biosynthesis protein FlhA [Anaerobranca californiensis DSM 14826]|jgi:flagellar biosynthesis protein FlhA|uniref:Flagellar biosynthesis protein FlhA n=1 Tax=Anaerobranca californiensis DSM 14826 TaxID=1120989 RepID=A0A1M6KHL5_9FIRM|nr:flagellar biosynthesis protein FlhA [Anaerobranca californiensis]SHJ58425.1 flagellar biosynthesis protein FlhA [Anaerobranca californiensis DSM 14826]